MRVLVLGCGAWGTALSILLARSGCDVVLAGRSSQVIDAIHQSSCNPYLPHCMIPQTVQPILFSDIVFDGYSCVFCVVPTQCIREVLGLFQDSVPVGLPFVMCSKGIENGTRFLPYEICSSFFPFSPYAVLSGPNFADEVANGCVSAAVIASSFSELSKQLMDLLYSPSFRPYGSSDVIGVSWAGVIKNIIAIAIGIADGRSMGKNAESFLISRGCIELRRFILACGGLEDTVLGVAGLGDLFLTCGSMKSRNRAFGYRLGQHQFASEIMPYSGVVEGVCSVSSVVKKAEELVVDMPVCQSVYKILELGFSIDQTIHELLTRPLQYFC